MTPITYPNLQAKPLDCPEGKMRSALFYEPNKVAYEQEKEILQFSRLAMRIKDTVNMDKVSKLKDLVTSGKINDYLNSLDNNAIADAILQSPSGAFLR